MIRDPQGFGLQLQAFAAWTREIGMSLEREIEHDDAVSERAVEQIRALGLFGLSIPRAYGGSGMTLEELCLSAMELAYASMALRARYSGNTGIASEGLIQDGTEAQKKTWLPRLASGEITGCLALTEPQAGSDATNIQTSAREVGEDFVLDGIKTHVTNAPQGGLFTVFARTEPGRTASGVTAFLLPRETAGLSVGEPYQKMGLRGSQVCDVRLSGCRVPASSILGGPAMLGRGFSTALKALNKQRIHLSAMAVAQSRRLIDEALEWTTRREQFGQRLAEFQMVQSLLAECQVEYLHARSFTLELARSYDAGADVTMQASACKYFATEAAGRTADRVVQLFGGSGFTAQHPVERIYRDVRVMRLYEGTSQIHLLNIAKQMIKKFQPVGHPSAAPAGHAERTA